MSSHERLEREIVIADGRAWHSAARKPARLVGRVAGVWYYRGAFDDITCRAQPGARRWSFLAAIREPDNPHDPNAIALWTPTDQVGHVPAVLAAELAPMVDAGNAVWARVVQQATRRYPTWVEVAYFGAAIEVMERGRILGPIVTGGKLPLEP